MSRVEQGKAGFTARFLSVVAGLLQCSPADLVAAPTEKRLAELRLTKYQDLTAEAEADLAKLQGEVA